MKDREGRLGPFYATLTPGAFNRPRVGRYWDSVRGGAAWEFAWENQNDSALVVGGPLPSLRGRLRPRERWSAWWAPMDWSGPLTKPWKRPPASLADLGRAIGDAFRPVLAWLLAPSNREVVELALHVEKIKADASALGMDQARIDAILREAAEKAKTSVLSTRTIFDAVWDRERIAWSMGQFRSIMDRP